MKIWMPGDKAYLELIVEAVSDDGIYVRQESKSEYPWRFRVRQDELKTVEPETNRTPEPASGEWYYSPPLRLIRRRHPNGDMATLANIHQGDMDEGTLLATGRVMAAAKKLLLVLKMYGPHVAHDELKRKLVDEVIAEAEGGSHEQ